jgi:putative flippase GtrA
VVRDILDRCALVRSRFIRFLLVGALNTAFGYGVYALLILLHVPYPIAVFLSTAAGVLFNFKTYGALVFGSHDNRLIGRFILVYALIYVLNLIPLAWAKRNGVSLIAAGAVIALPMAAISFALNRRFVFGAVTPTEG